MCRLCAAGTTKFGRNDAQTPDQQCTAAAFLYLSASRLRSIISTTPMALCSICASFFFALAYPPVGADLVPNMEEAGFSAVSAAWHPASILL
jgi:hypothetical protein